MDKSKFTQFPNMVIKALGDHFHQSIWTKKNSSPTPPPQTNTTDQNFSSIQNAPNVKKF